MVRISLETLLGLYLFAIIFSSGFKTPGIALLLPILSQASSRKPLPPDTVVWIYALIQCNGIRRG
jgi:hypothetical protein